MSISDEDIIAFLMGDASEEMAECIRAQLPLDPDLAERISHFRRVFGQLDLLASNFEPPCDLVDKTLARIDNLGQKKNGDYVFPDSESSPVVESNRNVGVGLSASPTEGSKLRRTWSDSIALTLSLSLLCCMALPILVRARFEARKSQCAENLRQTGMALFDFALTRPDTRLPEVPSVGPEAFAGVYTVRLNDTGRLGSKEQLLCASLLGFQRPTICDLQTLPTLAELRDTEPSELMRWQQVLGGDYAYNLGIFENECVVSPQHQGRSYFAILADAPMIVNDSESLVAHDGQGINILFDDGRVVFVTCTNFVNLNGVGDDPFRNLDGDHKAGLHVQDASLAPSHFSPLGQ